MSRLGNSSSSTLQKQALVPTKSVWVSASAGTGKTKVLVDRLLALLLHGVPPEQLLCLTFTKAAAAEMETRLLERTGRWSQLSHEEIALELQDILHHQPTEKNCQHAQKLFVQLTEKIGGVRIQTVHAFAQFLLNKFPLEADVAPQFQVIDDLQKKDILMSLLRTLSHKNDGLFSELTQTLSWDGFWGIVEEAFFSHQFGQYQPHDDITTHIRTFLEVSPQDTPHTIEQLIRTHIPSQFVTMIPLLTEQSGNLKKLGDILKTPDFSISAYTSIFLRDDGEKRERLVPKAFTEGHPEVAPLIQSEAERVALLHQRWIACTIAQESQALADVLKTIRTAYWDHKRRFGFLDYDDLIERAAALLERPDIAPWVFYKLDGGISHILVDEAQDTNYAQWRIIDALAHEFLETDSPHGAKRTLFVVGDAKQSIYSFQGANPRLFSHTRERWSQADINDKNWYHLSLDMSFRSTQAVLTMVDAVFAREDVREGLGLGEDTLHHKPYRLNAPGVVEVWPLVPLHEPAPLTPWTYPETLEQEGASSKRLANAIAQRIETWLSHGRAMSSRNRPLRAGDILILVRQRGMFMEELVHALKRVKVPVSGMDRMILQDQLVVQDLMALARFCLFPSDDLTAACVLKGPFIGLTEEELFKLCHQRAPQTVWQRFQEIGTPHHVTFLKSLMKHVAAATPSSFYSHLLYAYQGKEKLLRHLGWEALDPLEEFFALAFQYESQSIPTLSSFLTYLATHPVEVKRDTSQGREDMVRVMTVHGSKGLQAPVVFLADAGQVPRVMDTLYWADTPTGPIPLWPRGHKPAPRSLQALKEQKKSALHHEYHRLLYVGMTRAEDELYVCGWANARDPSLPSWHNVIRQEAEQKGISLQKHDLPWSGTMHRFTIGESANVMPSTANPMPLTDVLPSWLHHNIAPEYLSFDYPSKHDGNAQNMSELPAPPLPPQEWGVHVHTLLEHFPSLSLPMRDLFAMNYAQKYQLSEDTLKMLLGEVQQVLDHPTLHPMFLQENGLSEGTLRKQEGMVHTHARLDRLYVDETHKIVHLLEFKTTRKIPRGWEHVGDDMRHQIMSYAQMIQKIFPLYFVRVNLVFTAIPCILEMDFKQEGGQNGSIIRCNWI